ncbi:MAG: 30S ribosomal protein S12 methylthiotransferase RimO [Dysgonamonadaceae bacterium]|jgi:ribosomal protein S12 methylthiotransferase|nr:30S ribosomal protein S12 methylthiotransferase RimO [Dysgonamonadaceae bacterium]
MKHRTVDIISLGCSKNLVDSERLLRQFEAAGYTARHDPADCAGNITVINTCGFIREAKEESIETILRFAAARKNKQLRKLFVMGCLPERYLAELSELIPEVDKFYGKFNWQELLADLGETHRPELYGERTLTTPAHYAYVKIAEGCNRTCSFCAIPLITGAYQSRTCEAIESEVQALVARGVKEFQLIAQDLTGYGKDIYGKYSLPALVERLADIRGVEWIRLHYAYPAHFPMELLRVMRERPNVCNYLDIALQHSSDAVLKKMRRNISRAETVQLIAAIREQVPGIHLRTTLMVGHPGETEADFEDLLHFVDAMRFERLGAFCYSEEEGTFAARRYKDSVPDAVKQQRIAQLMSRQETIAAQVNEAKVGRTLKVIIDREESGYYIGRTEYDSPEVDPEVLIENRGTLATGGFYPVRITGTQSFDLIGCVQPA